MAVGAGHRDAVFQPHQFGQHFSPWNNRNGGLLGGNHFGIVGRDGRRNDHDICVADLLRPVAGENLPALGLQSCGEIR